MIINAAIFIAGASDSDFGEDMFGVVLWSDRQKNRAVIWCEDHGDLAFYKGDCGETLDSVDIEPGDLVQFTVRAERNMRLASQPRLVASDEYPTLARDLRKAGQLPDADPVAKRSAADRKIVAFDPTSAATSKGAATRRRAI